MKARNAIAQLLGWLLILTPIVAMHVINPIAKKTIKWAEVTEPTWVAFAMLVGLGVGALMASEDAKKHWLVFATIFFAVLLHIIIHLMFLYNKYGGDMIQSGLDLIYLSITAVLAFWLWKRA